MAASVRIDDEAFSDRRYDLLARALGLPDADCARGKMAAIWRQCTQQQAHVLDVEIVRVILGDNGVDALVKSRLGEVVSDGVRICGTRGRIEWLAKLRKNGRKGGRPRKPNGNHLVSISETRSEPDPNPPAPAPAPAQDPDGEGDRFALAPQEPRRPPAPKQSMPGQQETVAAFHDAYLAQNGVAPTWGPKQAGQIKRLVSAHGAEEVQRRIAILFGGQGPAFIAAPFDVGTLAQHFDKLAQPSVQARASPRFGTSDPGQIAYDELQRLRAAERDAR